MPGVYVGDTKSLVFPMLCDGYIKQAYSDQNPADQDLEVRGGLWGQTTPFTIEAIVTPYDVNGYGTKTGTGGGILDSQKTSPSLSNAVTSNLTHYQSNYYFDNRTAQKMHLFYNKNFELYLENTTISTTGLKNKTFNRPAEYRIVAKIHQENTTKVTATSDTIIKANNLLHGYYDTDGYYDGVNTELTKISSTALNVTPSKEMTIANNNFTGETNVSSASGAGSVTFSGAPESYYPAQSATTNITFSGNNFSVDTAPSANTAGSIKFDSNPNHSTTSDLTTYIQIVSEDGNTTTKWFPVDGSQYSNNVDLYALDNDWGAGARGFIVGGDAEATVGRFASAINAWNSGWAGSVTAGQAVGAAFGDPNIEITFVAAIVGTTPNRVGSGGSITIGSGLSGIDRTQISGGVDESVVTNNFLTINTGGGDKKYHPVPSGSGISNGSITNRGGTNFIAFQKGSTLPNSMVALKNAINNTTNGNTQVTAVTLSNNGVKLTADTGGTGGNSFTVSKTNMAHATVSNFSGGESASEPTQHIQLVDSDGTTTKFLAAHSTKSSNANGSTITLNSVVYVIYRLPTIGSNRANFASVVNGVSALDITAVNDGSDGHKVNLTQGTAGSSGNTTITENVSNVNAVNFTGGVTASNPNVSINITDADGTLIKYKPSVNESTGSTDGTYIFFQKGADVNATATNLASAINSAHGGDITATTPGNSSTVKIVMATAGNAYAISENSSSVTLAGNNTTFDTSGNQNITLGSGEANLIGAGEKIYDATAQLIGTTSDVSGNVLTLDASPLVPVTTTLYASQPREALYVESTYRISCSYTTNSLKIYVNGTEVASQDITTTTLPNGFFFDPSDCRIGQGLTRASEGSSTYTEDRKNQFMGEIFEICMHSRTEPSPRNSTLSVGLSDIIFYYRFGDE